MENFIDYNDLISVQEAAAVGNITEGYIRRKFAEGKLGEMEIGKDFQKIGRDWFVRRESWLDFVAERNKRNNKKIG